jgi:AraC-like DNA-binding protein
VRRAADLEQFRREPAGRYFAGRTWVHFCARPELWGVVLFGRPDRDDAERMTGSFAVEIAPGVPRHVTLVDARQLEAIDPSAFALLQEFARRHLEHSRQRVSRLALVQPTGMPGAVVAGFYAVLAAPFVVEGFDSRSKALAWLGQPDGLSAELEQILAELRGTPPLLGALRALLREQLAAPAIARACRELGLAQRTLQRRLREVGTSFYREVQALRLEAARARLRDSDDPVTVVALELGFASSQHFARQFRGATGESPTAWRARVRAGR